MGFGGKLWRKARGRGVFLSRLDTFKIYLTQAGFSNLPNLALSAAEHNIV